MYEIFHYFIILLNMKKKKIDKRQARPPIGDHPKCQELAVAHKNIIGWLLTRTEGVSSKSKVSIHLNFGREFIACNNYYFLVIIMCSSMLSL